MSKLKAVKPEILEPEKPKFLLSGPFGCGKTYMACGFPKPYYFDHEGSAKREQYRKRIIEQGGAYFGKEQGSQDFKSVIEEIKLLATEKHDYLSVVFDSISFLTNLEASIAEEKVGSDFGRDRKEAYKLTRQLLRWIEKLDMAVIFIAHQKDKWGGTGQNRSVIGTTYDAYDKIEGILDLWLEMLPPQGDKRICQVRKSRITSMPQNMVIDASYSDFAKLYGGAAIIEKAPTQFTPITDEQMSTIKQLRKKFDISDETVQKWFKKKDIESFDEASKEDAQRWIDYYNK